MVNKLKSSWRSFRSNAAQCWRSVRGWFYKYPWLKYVIVLVLFFIIPLLFGDSNIFRQLKNSRRIGELRHEVELQKKLFRADSIKLEEIRANKGGVEHTARELYYMKAEDETIFLIVDSTEQTGENKQ
ncbi:Uncharacterised protein [Porphyromonas macacae]|uniref:Septum formation initiator n=1 Tax=Porphyromonas macacae TaxID=28115 RepID=A0A379E6H2_9PORP|nr:hypothetical protein [Porphyromonas macacae]SUB88313.1 Uncharacterised protein [Porphyromonas macacae]